MLAFIDESGDAGLKIDGSSTEFLVVILVVFRDRNEALLADSVIEDHKRTLGVGRNWEFKFNKSSKARRLEFLELVKDLDFEIFGVIVKKRKLVDDNIDLKESLLAHACRLACESALEALDDATVIIDGAGSRHVRRQMNTYLKKELNRAGDEKKRIRKVKIEDSRKNNLLQLADMVSGAIARSYSQKSDASVYRSVLSFKEMSVEIWPKD